MKRTAAIGIVVLAVLWFFLPNLVLLFVALPAPYDVLGERFPGVKYEDYIGSSGDLLEGSDYYDLGMGRELVVHAYVQTDSNSFEHVVTDIDVILNSRFGSKKNLERLQLSSNIQCVEIYRSLTFMIGNDKPIIVLDGSSRKGQQIIDALRTGVPDRLTIKFGDHYILKIINSDATDISFTIGHGIVSFHSNDRIEKYRTSRDLTVIIESMIQSTAAVDEEGSRSNN